MNWVGILLLMFISAFTLILLGQWVAVALGTVGFLGLIVFGSSNLMQVIGNVCWKTTIDFSLAAIPLFLFMGEIILKAGLSKKFYQGIARYISWIPGGLLHSNILACGIFSAISGSSVATAAAIGSVAIPEMKDQRYNKRYIYGSLAAGGTLGILIPPSIALIIYGSLTDQSVVKLFKASMIPGILLMLSYMVYLFFIAIINKKDFEHISIKENKLIPHREALIGILPMIILVAAVMGSIYSGHATPTEAAGLGVAIAIITGKIFGKLTWKSIISSMKSASITTAMILFIMIGAQIFAYVMTATSASRQLVSWLVGINMHKYMLLSIIYVVYIILGCFMDGNSMQFLTIPILYPVLMSYGFDPIWFGVVLVVLIEMGQITPPMGLNLFVIKGLDEESDLKDIMIGAIPYMFIMLAFVILLTVFPRIATFVVS